MRWSDKHSLAGTPLEGYSEALTAWVASLCERHVGFVPDLFPDHFYTASQSVDGDVSVWLVAFAPKCLWLPPKPIDHDAIDVLFALDDENGHYDLRIGAKEGVTIPSKPLLKVLTKFKLAA